MNNDGTAVAKLTDTAFPFQGYKPAWSPDGKKLAIGRWRLLTINVDGTNKTALWEGHDPVWALDGEHIILYSEQTPYGIISLNVETGEITPLIQIGEAYHLTLSSDGRKIAFVRSHIGQPHMSINEIGINGNNERFLKSGMEPSWSPDGRKIAFTRDGIRIYDLDANEETFLVEGSTPAWSPKGDKIAYQRPGGGISLISVDGTWHKNLTDFGSWPAWSPLQT